MENTFRYFNSSTEVIGLTVLLYIRNPFFSPQSFQSATSFLQQRYLQN